MQLCNIVNDQDVTDKETILEAVKEAGLDRAKFKRGWAIDYPADGELKKAKPTDILPYRAR